MYQKIGLIFILLVLSKVFFCKEPITKDISIIFEGLPMDGIKMTDENVLLFNNNMTDILKILRIPAVGFINEILINEPNDTNLERRKVVLEFWIKNNLSLGNFTYQRLNPNEVSFEKYKEDIEKGELISNEFLKRVNKKVTYFRNPYEEPIRDQTKKKKILDFIKEKNYTIIPKTMDNNDDIFNVCYMNSKVKNDSLINIYIVKKYLDYTKKMINYYENLAIKNKGKIFPQILSLKLNVLNIDVFPYIISMIQEKGYNIVNLNNVINSSVYLSMTDEQKMSNFWSELNKIPLPKKPEIPIVIKKFYEQLTNQNYILE